MTISNTPIVLTDFSRFFNDYIKHTHRLDLLHQVLPWLYQTQPSLRLISVGFSMNISNTSIATMGVFDIVMEKPPEVSRGDGCVCHSYCKTYWSQSRRWVCLIKSWTSADFSMTISNTPIVLTDFSSFFHDYVKHTPLRWTSAGFSMTMSSTHLFNWLQQVFPWLYQTHQSPRQLVEAMGVFDSHCKTW
jgi:predicted methyltransferase